MTVAEYEQTWLEAHGERRSPSTKNTYGYDIKAFLADFGSWKLRDVGRLRRFEAREWANGVSYHQYRAAHVLLNDALDDELIDSNPLRGLRKNTSTGRRELEPPSVEDVLNLAKTARSLGHAWSPIMGPAIEFAFGTLFRPGELCAVGPEDFNLDAQAVKGDKGVDRFGTIGTTKTGTSGWCALVPLAERAVEEVNRVLPPDRDRLFVNSRHEHLRPQTLAQWWNVVRLEHAAQTGERRFVGIDLYLATRHAGASYMRNDLEISPEDVAAQLRHRGAKLVDLYTHPRSSPVIKRILSAWPDDLGRS